MSTLFSDDFNRTNSDVIGNGWTEVGEDSIYNFRIVNNELMFQGSAGAAVDTVLYQSISQQNAVKITFKLIWDDATGGTHYIGFVTKSDGTFGSGVGMRINRDSASQITIAVVDNNSVKTSTTYSMADATYHQFEIIINSDYSIEIRAWATSGGSRPSVATLSQTVFTPNASGTNQAMFRTQTGGNARNAQMDNWLVESIAVPNNSKFFLVL